MEMCRLLGIPTSGADESSDDEMDSSSDEDPDQMTSVLFLSVSRHSIPNHNNDIKFLCQLIEYSIVQSAIIIRKFLVFIMMMIVF